MCKILCVTNRKLCREDFFVRLEKIAEARPDGIILREKDMAPQDYEETAKKALEICGKHSVPCILHSFSDIALKLGCDKLHVPIHILRELAGKENFTVLGCSVHSAEEAKEAENLGCTYITAGHIFATDCKKGVPPRGTDFLKAVKSAVNIPVYGIGGITRDNIKEVFDTGAGACIMSTLMTCENVKKYISSLKNI